MKILIPILILAFVVSASAQAQAEKPISNIEQFSAKSGTLFEKRFIDVGKVNQVKVQAFIVTDLMTKSSLSGVRFAYTYVGSSAYSIDEKVAVLDADEIDGLIKSINLMKSSVFNTTKSDYTEVIYYSRSGFSAGTYFDKDKGKWQALLKLEKYDSRSSVFMNPESFDQLLVLLEQAKERIK